jgi:hypothetical protein
MHRKTCTKNVNLKMLPVSIYSSLVERIIKQFYDITVLRNTMKFNNIKKQKHRQTICLYEWMKLTKFVSVFILFLFISIINWNYTRLTLLQPFNTPSIENIDDTSGISWEWKRFHDNKQQQNKSI